ncbi:SDR family oxidoreductase [Sphaerisporangium sp. TRM90804]|uniref:SDR family oxidoreductase n=1 Tax=Sphaerisporangium sp. TRM90804 TaxID=3031113 RepID=UPI00244BC13F|nr:SDR family oxidoreductase [Sphaerisporangium sp. TRM90804]MDH2424604.1 SDR family oxidoreductase [Sphaerisporangium sp. TRM90804]
MDSHASPLTGKVAVITGASSGIGEAAARTLHGAGASVVVAARREQRLKELCQELGPARADWMDVDIRDPADARRLMGAAVERFGRIDALIANAGIGAYGGILDYSDAEVRQLIDTNLTGTIWCVRAAVPLLPSEGDIVLVSSVAGLRGRKDEAVYAATKHGVTGLAGSLDRELRERGIRVTALCPGAVATEFALGRGREGTAAQFARMLRADDVAQAIMTVLTQPRTMRTLLWSMRSMESEN